MASEMTKPFHRDHIYVCRNRGWGCSYTKCVQCAVLPCYSEGRMINIRENIFQNIRFPQQFRIPC